MIMCSQCEFFRSGDGGQASFRCDPLVHIKEPECLAKWQILRTSELSAKIDRMVVAYEATLDIYKRLQPMQEKMLRHMEREIDDADDTDAWKYGPDGNDEEDGERI